MQLRKQAFPLNRLFFFPPATSKQKMFTKWKLVTRLESTARCASGIMLLGLNVFKHWRAPQEEEEEEEKIVFKKENSLPKD